MQTKRGSPIYPGVAGYAMVAIFAILFNFLAISRGMTENTVPSHSAFTVSNSDYPLHSFLEPRGTASIIREDHTQTTNCHLIFLPIVAKKYPSPNPSPTVTSIFGDRPDACYSPHGSVPPSCKISSPDGKLYVMQLAGMNGKFGVFDVCNNGQLNTFTGETGNDLKGMAFSPSSNQVALLYHYAGRVHKICLIDKLLDTSTKTCRSITLSTYYHYIVYLTDDYLAFSSGSESNAIVYSIKNGPICTLAEWRANGEACPTTSSSALVTH